ncbi:MAG: hypothetical protein QNJ78_11265 [Gammaproteobacteria bacterium]|nr:hypothetical protein [Gammaproteobacteria bacterium]
MRLQNITTAILISCCLLITACASTPTTDIKTYEASIFSGSADATLGIIKFDIRQFEPMGTGQAVAGQFGLLGALVWASAKDAENAANYTVNQRDTQFYRQTLSLLEQRLSDSRRFRYTDVVPNTRDDVELSRHIRNIRLHGSDAPEPEETTAFCARHQLDLAFYGDHYGGIHDMDNSLVMSSNWRIYDPRGIEVVSVFTRSVNDQISAKTVSEGTRNAALIALFEENMQKFFQVLQQGKP